jgi:hypothetical protein
MSYNRAFVTLRYLSSFYTSATTTSPYLILLVMRIPADSLKSPACTFSSTQSTEQAFCFQRRGGAVVTPIYPMFLLHSGVRGAAEWLLTLLLTGTLPASNQVRPRYDTHRFPSTGRATRQVAAYRSVDDSWVDTGGEGWKVTAILPLHVKMKATFH